MWRERRRREMRPKIDHAICRISHAQKAENIFSFARVGYVTPPFYPGSPPSPAFTVGCFGMRRSPSSGCSPSGEASTAPSFPGAASPSIQDGKLNHFSPFTTRFGFISFFPSSIF